MIILTNKQLEEKLHRLEQLLDQNTKLIETIQQYHNNGKVLLLEDMTEVLVSKLQSLANDDKTIVIYSKDGHRIEIREKDTNLQKRKNYF